MQDNELVCIGGSIFIQLGEEVKYICIYYVYMEEDVGKLMYDSDDLYSYIDLNCVGMFLFEIVIELDLCLVEEVDVLMMVMW